MHRAKFAAERAEFDHGRGPLRRAEDDRGASGRGRDAARSTGESVFLDLGTHAADPGHPGPGRGRAADARRGAGARPAARAPDRARRRLCRPRAGAGLPPLRQPRDRDRARPAAPGPRGPRRRRGDPRGLRGGRDRGAARRRDARACRGAVGRAGAASRARRARASESIEGSDILVAAGRTPNTARDRPGGGRRRAGRARLHQGQRAPGDDRARRLGDGRVRRQPAVHARGGRRFPRRARQPGRRRRGRRATGWFPTACSPTRRWRGSA